jgi:hypothetical protein
VRGCPGSVRIGNGVDEFHFYTLNRPELTYMIAHILGVRRSIMAAPASAEDGDVGIKGGVGDGMKRRG